jgi:hypothetical protein
VVIFKSRVAVFAGTFSNCPAKLSLEVTGTTSTYRQISQRNYCSKASDTAKVNYFIDFSANVRETMPAASNKTCMPRSLLLLDNELSWFFLDACLSSPQQKNKKAHDDGTKTKKLPERR